MSDTMIITLWTFGTIVALGGLIGAALWIRHRQDAWVEAGPKTFRIQQRFDGRGEPYSVSWRHSRSPKGTWFYSGEFSSQESAERHLEYELSKDRERLSAKTPPPPVTITEVSSAGPGTLELADPPASGTLELTQEQP